MCVCVYIYIYTHPSPTLDRLWRASSYRLRRKNTWSCVFAWVFHRRATSKPRDGSGKRFGGQVERKEVFERGPASLLFLSFLFFSARAFLRFGLDTRADTLGARYHPTPVRFGGGSISLSFREGKVKKSTYSKSILHGVVREYEGRGYRGKCTRLCILKPSQQRGLERDAEAYR